MNAARQEMEKDFGPALPSPVAAPVPKARKPRGPSRKLRAMLDAARAEGYESARADMGPPRMLGFVLAGSVCVIVGVGLGALLF